MFMNESCKYIGFPYDKILLKETDRATQRVALTYFRLSVIYHLYSVFGACSHNGKLPPFYSCKRNGTDKNFI